MELEVEHKNIIRGVLIGLVHLAYTVLLPYFLVDLVPEMSMGMIAISGNIEVLKNFIIGIGCMTVSVKMAKGISPKQVGSIRREILNLIQKVLRFLAIGSVVFVGSSVITLSMGSGMGLTMDLTNYFIAAMGFVIIRMIVPLYALIEAIVITKKDLVEV